MSHPTTMTAVTATQQLVIVLSNKPGDGPHCQVGSAGDRKAWRGRKKVKQGTDHQKCWSCFGNFKNKSTNLLGYWGTTV